MGRNKKTEIEMINSTSDASLFKEGGMAGNKFGALPEQMLEGALLEFKLV